MTATPQIRTDRLELLPLGPRHAVQMATVFADPALYALIDGEPPTAGKLRVTYRRWAAGSRKAGEEWHNWMVRLGAGGEAIGHVQATVTGAGREADIAWLIGTPWQGHGYAAEAARAIVGWLASRGVTTITAHVHPGHAASGRVAAAAGLAPTTLVEDGEVVWRREIGPGRERARW